MNYFKESYLLLAVVFLSFPVFGQDKKWTLEECIDYGVVNNILIKQSELQEEAANIRTDLAKGAFYPSLMGSAQHGWTLADAPDLRTNVITQQTIQSSTFGLSLGINIYSGMKLQHQLARTRLAYMASVYSVQKMKEDISLNVINAYLQIVFSKELVKTNTNQLTFDEQDEVRTTKLVDAGVVPAGDLLDVKATVATSSQRLIQSQNELVMAKLNLAQLLQLDSFDTFDVDDVDYKIVSSALLKNSPQEIAERAAEYLTTIKTAQLNVDMAERDVKIARSNYQPTLSGFYNLNTAANYQNRVVGRSIDPNQPYSTIGIVENSGDNVLIENTVNVVGNAAPFFDQFNTNLNSNFGFSLSVPIFQGLSVRNTVKLNQLALKQRMNEKEVAELELEQLVFKAYTDTASAFNSYEASLATLEAREKSLEYARERYGVGLISIFDLNQNQNLFITAQSNLLKAKYDYIFKNKILEYYFGVPLFRN